MKAWRIYEPNNIKLDELAAQPIGQGCVKVKIGCAAITYTDRLIYEGKLNVDKLPFTIGRQGVGMVTEVGEGVTAFSRGDRVVTEPYLACGTCANCKNGKFNDCEKMLTYGFDEDGFMCDFAVVGTGGLYKLPERVKDSEAVFLEQIAVALNAFSKLEIEKGEHIAIVGANITGIILAQIALYYQAIPIIIDTRQDRLDIAESLGVYYTVNSVDSDVHKKIFSLTGGKMAETVAHMASTAMPVSRSLKYARQGGRAVIVGFLGANEELSVSLVSVIDKQLSLFGVNNGSKFMPSAINMLANKSVNVMPLISQEVSFADVDKTMKEMSQLPNKYIRVIVKS